MSRVSCAVALLAAAGLFACGSSASLEFANGSPSYADGGDDSPYPDAAGLDLEAGNKDAPTTDAGEAPKCASGKDGKSNICVRVLRGSDGPVLGEDAKSLHGIDGHGAVLVALASAKPEKDVTFVASTWLPTESSGAGKFAATELPKIAELSVPPGTYWAFAVFRDKEPYMRPGVAIGDYMPRLVELPQVTVVANMGANVDVRVHPVRAIDLDVKLVATPSGNGIGPIGAWALSEGKVIGDGRSPCSDLSYGKTDIVRVFTTYTGDIDVAAALFDFALPVDDGGGALPTFPAGTLYNAPLRVKIAESEWLATKTRVALDKAVAVVAPKPTDPSPNCTTYSAAAK